MTTINQNTNNPWNNLMQETGDLFNQAAEAVADAGNEFVENTAKRFGDAGDAFEKHGIVSGLIETADALSLGSRVADLADAVGLVENKAGKEAVSAFTNAMSSPLVMVKDLFDLNNEVMSPKEAKKRNTQQEGYSLCEESSMTSVSALRENPIVKTDLITKISDTYDFELKRHGVTVEGPDFHTLPIENRDLSAILKDPHLSFEDRVAMVLAHVCQDMQKEIEDELERLTKMGKPKAPSSQVKQMTQSAKKLCVSQPQRAKEDMAQFLKKMAPVADVLLPVVAPMVSVALAGVPGAGPILAPLAPMALGLLKEAVFAPAKQGNGAQPTVSAQQWKLGGTTQSLTDGTDKKSSSDARALQMEKIKQLNNRLSQMQQALSNILNNMHQTSMQSVRRIAA